MTVESNYAMVQLLLLVIGLKFSRKLSTNKKENQNQPLLARAIFPRFSWESLIHGIATNSDWFIALFASAVIGRNTGVQGWRSGERTHLPPMWPGFDSQTRRHMWVEFVGSLLCTESFSPGTPVSPLLKNQHLAWFALIVNFSLQCPQLVLQR